MTKNLLKNGVLDILRQPLAHFLLVGAAIFAIGIARGDTSPKSEAITVTSQEVERLASVFERTWGRAPSEAELRGIVREHIREEIYYREALKLGLDIDDTVIRRRLRQKMEFISTGSIELAEPSDDELRQYFDANKEKYLTDPVYSFSQLYFRDSARALAAREQLPDAVGDQINLPPAMVDTEKAAIARIFGADFAAEIDTLRVGEWSGPVRSGFGAHLVLVSQKSPSQIPPLAAIRTRLVNDWKNERRLEMLDAVFQDIADGYDVTIEVPDA